MDENVIADLKQFIAATVSRQVSGLRGDFDSLRGDFTELRGDFDSLRGDFDQLRTEMNQRFDDLNAKVDSIADAHSEDISDHEKRITSLEQPAATA